MRCPQRLICTVFFALISAHGSDAASSNGTQPLPAENAAGGAANPVPFPTGVSLLCSGRNDDAPVYLTRDPNGLIERFELRRDQEGTLQGGYVAMSEAELRELCAERISLATMPKPVAIEDSTKRARDDSKVAPSASLPASFSVFGWGGTMVIGNVWVPAPLPTGQNAHSVQFDVQQNNFRSASQAGGGHHFAVFLLASSPSNFTSDYFGKGMIFGWDGLYCKSQNGGNPVYAAMTETWVKPNPYSSCSTPNCACQSPHYKAEARVASGVTTSTTCMPGGPGNNGFAASESPWHTCKFLSDTMSYTYNVSATRSQLTKYWMRPVGTTTWQPAALVDSYHPNFPGGYAGISMGVVAMSANVGSWSLVFSNVAQWTTP